LPHIVVRVSRLTDLSLRNRSLVALATVIIALVGIVSALTLTQQLLPDRQLPKAR
jgi:HAE1 family hydrophobic/amphiphilic exporter-1